MPNNKKAVSLPFTEVVIDADITIKGLELRWVRGVLTVLRNDDSLLNPNPVFNMHYHDYEYTLVSAVYKSRSLSNANALYHCELTALRPGEQTLRYGRFERFRSPTFENVVKIDWNAFKHFGQFFDWIHENTTGQWGLETRHQHVSLGEASFYFEKHVDAVHFALACR